MNDKLIRVYEIELNGYVVVTDDLQHINDDILSLRSGDEYRITVQYIKQSEFDGLEEFEGW